MYDTIEILSPSVSGEMAYVVKNKSIMTQRIDMETGEILHQITTSELKGSYDARLSIRIFGDRIKVSGSVHKFILGHNVFGGPDDIKACCRYLVALTETRLGVSLPNWGEWELMRADIAHVYDLGAIDAVRDYMRMMRGAVYPRRKTQSVGFESVYWAGLNGILKMYNKGPEYRKHDLPRLIGLENKGIYDHDTIELLGDVADRLIRVEVGVRKRLLKYNKESNKCKDLRDEYFNIVYENEVLKVLREGDCEMEIVRNVKDVKERLRQLYGKRKANNLFAVWSRIQLEGESAVKEAVSIRQWYYYKRDLANAGVSMRADVKMIWESQEVSLEKDKVRNFVPMPYTPQWISGVFCDVNEAIRQLEITA